MGGASDWPFRAGDSGCRDGPPHLEPHPRYPTPGAPLSAVTENGRLDGPRSKPLQLKVATLPACELLVHAPVVPVYVKLVAVAPALGLAVTVTTNVSILAPSEVHASRVLSAATAMTDRLLVAGVVNVTVWVALQTESRGLGGGKAHRAVRGRRSGAARRRQGRQHHNAEAARRQPIPASRLLSLQTPSVEAHSTRPARRRTWRSARRCTACWASARRTSS